MYFVGNVYIFTVTSPLNLFLTGNRLLIFLAHKQTYTETQSEAYFVLYQSQSSSILCCRCSAFRS